MRRLQATAGAAAMGLLLPLVGCSTIPRQPDLKRLYAVSAPQRIHSPVVFMHGALGARLRAKTTKEEIWPGPISNFLFNRSHRIALDIAAALRAARVQPLHASHVL